MKIKNLAAILIVLVFIGCTPEKRYHEVLNLAENEMRNHPQKALALLDSLQRQHPEFSTRQRMKYELLRQDALNKTDNVFKSDSTAKMLADYYDRHGTPNEKMKAYYLLGMAYMDMKEWPVALQSMLDAASKADTTTEDCDYFTLSRVHGQASDIYRFQMMPYNQLQESTLSEKYAWLAGDRSSAIQEYSCRTDFYESLRNRDSVIAISERAAKLYKKYGYKQESAMMIGNAVHDLVLSGQYRKAAGYIDYYKAHSGLFDAKGNIAHEFEIFYYTLGLYYMGIGKPDSAEYYLRKELREGEDYNNQISANYGLAKLYMQTGRQALAAKYALRAYDINDSAYVQQTADRLQNIQSLYDYSRNQNITNQMAAENEHSRTVNYLLGGVIALFVASSYLFFKRRAENALHVREADQRKINELADSYHELQMLRNVEREHYDLMIRKKEEGIKQQSAEIFDAKSHEQKITEKAILIQNSEIYQRFLMHLSTNPSGELTDKDWADLKDWIKKNFQTLYDYLFTINALSDKDCMICMLAFLYFSPSDIALLFDCSTPNISAARRRIVEKLTGRPGRAKDLDKILKSHF